MSKLLAFFAALLFAGSAAAQQQLGPDQLVQKITDEVLAAIKSDKQLAAGDKQKAVKLAEEKVLPYIDFEQATRLAVGRAWREATPEQRKRLVTEFRNMLVRTYSNAIQAYEGQTLKVLPARGKQDPEETVVRTQFVRAGGQPLPIDFTMHQKDNVWKVYDITVEGVSLVMTYRSEFDAIVKQEGIDGLIKRLASKNIPAAVGSTAPKSEKK
ncbi:MAG: ABC transporter substrate-binding protein [Betaproteobacteria bacterium]|nr:MAG: ABC transporter substrate-binding protein [Betaproteobacteria bacterium]TMH44125.1 MAG: ABC transporter substrate-binding protein [Betaproteobacteria bacterium]